MEVLLMDLFSLNYIVTSTITLIASSFSNSVRFSGNMAMGTFCWAQNSMAHRKQ